MPMGLTSCKIASIALIALVITEREKNGKREINKEPNSNNQYIF